MSAVRPDKQKVIDEVWDDDRILSFLDKGQFGSEPDQDFGCLLHAYRSMRADDFVRFLAAFKAAGRNLNATSRSGETLLELIADHAQSEEFRAALRAAGAAA